MIVNYDKVIEEEVPMFKKSVEDALAFIKAKYPHLCFCGLTINLKSFVAGSNFRASKSKGWSVNVSPEYKFHLYNRKNCGFTTPSSGIKIPIEVDATRILIHELTHYAQGVLGGGVYSEIDTTKNEIEYFRVYHPEIYAKLRKTAKPQLKIKTNLEKIYETK